MSGRPARTPSPEGPQQPPTGSARRLRQFGAMLAMLVLCLLGGALLAGVVALVWPLPLGSLVIIAVAVGAISWLSVVTQPAERSRRRR
ncbi:hypothetical protein SAMN05216251_103201 [Actinacidiphila alni]|uniref:Uncharacterized protein n=1 Tax=Actinacidiphila alni TaxID=380248 RepID=A0A1I2ARI4_9ACTN|nr:hypothetical protein SAMN05216251_103201 [Actinacidiphila alni]